MTIILFILILSLIVVFHEFGHFLFAKLFGVHVYEFSLGMGKRLWYKKIGETEYSIRLVPLGGYVSLAGESVEVDESIDKENRLQSKSVWQRFLIMFAGPGFNFVLATFILFISAWIFGFYPNKAIVGDVKSDYPAYLAGIREGDLILEIDGKKIKSWDDAMWEIQLSNGRTLDFILKDRNNVVKNIVVSPMKVEEEDVTRYVYGIGRTDNREYGFINSIAYAYQKTGTTFKLMGNTIKSLFVGKVGVSELSGPIGIYSVVDSQSKTGIDNILYLIAFLSINVGVINLIPFPAFDGGRILFLIIEKIKGSPVDSKIENTIHNIGFMLLILLMIYVTFNDIFRIFKL